ncbi:MAG TPA: glycosyltransferase family 9 protein [Deltaproteobacteria bacterium]|nr:glycosyltransferase family 9 protein [Deltaproteobacteria bacterium]
MKIELQRKIDRVAGKAICRLLSLFPRKKDKGGGTPSSPKILVILLSEMGSLVLAYPMFALLKKKYPGAEIFVLVFKKNRECLETLKLVPERNILTVDGDSLTALLSDSVRFISKMRKEKIDAVIDCELFSRISSIYAFLSGATLRVGFHPHTQEGLYRGDFINRPVLYNPYRHISRQFVALATAMEKSDGFPMVKRNAEEDIYCIPALNLSADQQKDLQIRLENDFPETTGRELVLLYPGGGLLPIRAWPLNNFCRIAMNLVAKGYVVGIIGMKEDAPMAEVISSWCQSQDCIDLTGYTRTIMELITLFHFASLLITNDGGPGHFASLTPIPSIIFFGPETPALYGPLSEKAVSLYVPLPCSPCVTAYNHRKSPCDGDNVCLKAIGPEEVFEKACELLKIDIVSPIIL